MGCASTAAPHAIRFRLVGRPFHAWAAWGTTMAERVRLVLGHDGIATITLCHPPLNIYDLEMRDGLIEAISAVRDVPDVRCVVLAADGKHFSAGADLSEFGTASSIFDARRIRWDRDPWLPLRNLPVPTLCVMHGYALGSGLEMSLLCDLRISSDDAVMGLPETKLGMLPAAGGTQSLTAAIGPAAALPLVLSGRSIDAAEALRLGIVTEVVPTNDLLSRTAELTSALAQIDPRVTRGLHRCLRAANDLPLNDGLAIERRWANITANIAVHRSAS